MDREDLREAIITMVERRQRDVTPRSLAGLRLEEIAEEVRAHAGGRVLEEVDPDEYWPIIERHL